MDSEKKSKNLSENQKNIVNNILENPHKNFCILGSAGTGKSVLIKYLYKVLAEKIKRNDNITNVRVVTPTGLAASNIRGKVIHSAFGIKPNDVVSYMKSNKNVKKIIKKISADKPEIYSSLENIEILIIDEISMIEGRLFMLMDAMLKIIKKNDNVFGGIQMLIFGDFMQLPPISPIKTIDPIFAFETQLWKMSINKIYILTHIFRQENDDGFKDILEAIRWGVLTQEHRNILTSKNIKSGNYSSISQNISNGDNNGSINNDNNGDIEEFDTSNLCLRLHCKKEQVERDNNNAINNLIGEEKKYDIIHAGDYSYYKNIILSNSSKIPQSCRLKIGCHVLLTKNINPPNLVNGSLGIVIGFSKTTYNIKKVSSKSDTHTHFETYTLVEESPIVKFRGSNEEEIIKREEFSFGEIIKSRKTSKCMEKKVYFYQYPLVSGYACTGHKSQGMTLDNVVVRLENVFESAQIYVMLSRVKSLEGLKLFGLDPNKIRANEKALKFMKEVYDKCNKKSKYLDLAISTLNFDNQAILGKRKHMEDETPGIQLDTVFIAYNGNIL